ncbi:MAG: transposase [Chloroflexota bacterium]
MKEILDIYSDYLLSSFGQTTATGLSELLGNNLSHDQITRRLGKEKLTPKAWWKIVKPIVRQIEAENGVLIFDDSISEKPYTDENDIVCWHWDHSKNSLVKGINFITALYQVNDISLPVTFEIIEKTERYKDEKTGKEKRRSSTSKNEHLRSMARHCVKNELLLRYILADSWFSSAENMRLIKEELKTEFIFAIKSNRNVALSEEDKLQGQYQKISDLGLPENEPIVVYFEKVPFLLLFLRQVFTNEDGSIGVRYLVSSDMNLTFDPLITIFKKRWKVEEYHRSLKQNASLSKSPTKTEKTQVNHFIGSLWAFVKIEMLKVKTNKNHYQLKKTLYISAIKTALDELRQLAPITLGASFSA